MSAEAHKGPYCLECYAPIQANERALVTCERCGARLVREDLRQFWTRERRFVLIESGLKALVVLLVAGLFAFILRPTGHMHGNTGVGYSAGMPVLIGLLLWDTASLVTRRRSILRLEIVWPWMAVSVGMLPLIFVGALLLLINPRQFFDGMTPNSVMAFTAWFAFCALMHFLVRSLIDRMGRRRREYVERRRERAAVAVAAGWATLSGTAAAVRTGRLPGREPLCSTRLLVS